MNSLKIISTLALLILFSCTTKNQSIDNQNEFTTGLDQIKPSNKSVVKAVDFFRYGTAENFELLIRENRASFVVFGMASNDYSEFEEKYGIKVKTENCVILPGTSQLAVANNLIISNYLTEKYNDDWKSDLKMMPFGLN